MRQRQQISQPCLNLKENQEARIVTDSKRRKHVTPSKFINNKKDLQLNRLYNPSSFYETDDNDKQLSILAGKREQLNC